MLDELGLMARLRPHPETQELGCWLSRDEIWNLLDGVTKEGLDFEEQLRDKDNEVKEAQFAHEEFESDVNKAVDSVKNLLEKIQSELAGIES